MTTIFFNIPENQELLLFEKESGMEVVGVGSEYKKEGRIKIKGNQVALTRDTIPQIYINEIPFCLSVSTSHEMPD